MRIPVLSWYKLSLLALCLFALSASPPDSPNATRATDIATGTQLITPQKLKMHLSFIASDELEGRDTPSKGLDLAARYLASHLEYYGYTPAGDNGSYYQTIGMSRRRVSKDSKWAVFAGDQRVDFGYGVDYAGTTGDRKGELVFAGYGAKSTDGQYDDYAGLDVKDKVVVVLDGVPEGLDADQFLVEQRFGKRTFKNAPPKSALAQSHGAVGVITVKGADYVTKRENRPSPFESRLSRSGGERLAFDASLDKPTFDVEMTATAGEKLEDILGLKFAEFKATVTETQKPQSAKTNGRLEAEMKFEVTEKFSTQNVVALLEGSDPQLKDEVILISAHYDHVGVEGPNGQRKPGQGGGPPGDRIYNGADDDGSGTVGILNLAEAFAAVNRPRRSLLFVWHCGEEKGLWGSDYFVKYPLRPLDKIVANLNIDMIGRNLDDKPENSDHYHLIGASRTSVELRDIIYKVTGNRMRIDETDRANYFARSDHFHYARSRIPVAFFFTGEHQNYHKSDDHVDRIQFDKMKRILDIIFEIGLEVANRDARPAFSGQGF